MKSNSLIIILLITLILSLTACGPAPVNDPLDNTPPTDPAPAQPIESPTPEPTTTPEIVYFAMVNGEGIRKASFDASLQQLQTALETYPELVGPGQTAEDVVVQALVDRTLLGQAARAGGFTADLQMTVDKMAVLIDKAGGNEAFEAWLADNGYTLESFSYEVPLELEAAWQRDQIADSIPDQVEQVRAQQILFYDAYQASRAEKQLNAGIAFASVAQSNDPNNLGYLDWFPRGVLLIPELEEVFFSLQPGQSSDVIETEVGSHILYVYEKGLHPLSPEARMILEEQAVADWLAAQNASATVQVSLP